MGVLDFFLIIVAFCAFLKITNAGVIPFENSVVADSKNSSSEILPTYASNRFLHGLLASLYVIVISELGDKTFFIAAILSIDHPRLVVYTGAMAALATMTVLSALVGHATEVIPRIYTFYMSGFLFIIFGLKMLKDAYYMSPEDAKEEFQEVEHELSGKDPTVSTRCSTVRNIFRRFLSPVFVEAFIMTFLAEWGDRSQITTIVLASRGEVTGVIVGGCLGHGFCTGLAVLAGRLVSQRIPVKFLTAIGGATFLLFGIATFSTSVYDA